MKAKWDADQCRVGYGEYLRGIRHCIGERRSIKIGGAVTALLLGASPLVLMNAKSNADTAPALVQACAPADCETTSTSSKKLAADKRNVDKPSLQTINTTTTTSRPMVELVPSEPIDKAYFTDVLAPEFDKAGLIFIDSPTTANTEDMIVATKSADCALTFELDKVGTELRVTGLLAGAVGAITNPEIVARDTFNEGQTAHVSNSEAAGKDFELETVRAAADYLHKIALDTCGITSGDPNINQ